MNEASKSSPQQALADSAATIINILLGDTLQSIRSSVKALESNVQRQMEDLRKDTAQMVQNTEKTVVKRIDDLTRAMDAFGTMQNEARTKLETNTQQTILELREWMQKNNEAARVAMEQVKSAMEKELLMQQERIYNQFSAIEQHLDKHQNELLLRSRETRRISSLMSNFAKVLTEADVHDMAQPAPAQAPVRTGAGKQAPGKKEGQDQQMPVTVEIVSSKAGASQKTEKYSPNSASPASRRSPQDIGVIAEPEDEQLPTSDDIGQSMDNMFQVGGKK